MLINIFNLLIISSTVLVVAPRWCEMETISGYCIHWHAHKSMIHLNSLQIDILTIFYCCPYRSTIFMSHVPWLGGIILSYPMLIPDYKKFRLYAQARALRRIKEGTPYKDLFHHLVSYIIHLLFRRDILMINWVDWWGQCQYLQTNPWRGYKW